MKPTTPVKIVIAALNSKISTPTLSVSSMDTEAHSFQNIPSKRLITLSIVFLKITLLKIKVKTLVLCSNRP